MDFFEQLAAGRYGSFELKRVVGPNLLRGFIIAVLLHGVVAASPVIVELFKSEEEIADRIFVIDPSQVQPTLKRKRDSSVEQVVIARPKIAPPKAAIPIAVKEDEITEEPQLIASQAEIAAFVDAQSADEGLDIPDGAQIEIKETAGDEDLPDIDKFVPFEVEPKPLPDFKPEPKFPELARTAGVPGKVWVKVLVDKNGDVKKWVILKAEPKGLGFEEEVGKVITQWKFTPALQQGRPISVWVTWPFKFEYKR